MNDLIPYDKHSLFNTQKTTQNNNVVLGDQAAGDVIKNTYNINGGIASTELGRLIEKYKKEFENNIQFNEQIDKLQHYSTPLPDEKIIGLEAKLNAGQRLNYLPFAIQTKEIFVKKLAKYQFYEAAQEIHAFLLAEIYTRYNLHVYPQITSGTQESEINSLIQRKIIDPILGLFSENILHIYSDDINGMLYFLTGNCHIKWI